MLVVSEGSFGGKHTSFYELFRVENGKIAEHWDTIEEIPARGAWKNDNGKFWFSRRGAMTREGHDIPLGSGEERTVRRSAAEERTAQKGTEARNMELMQTLDDAWNAQDLETFAKRHKDDVVVRWPGQPPTHGVEAHKQEAVDFFRTFPDQHLDNRPYKVFFASGDWTCSIARFRGTMKGPMKGADGKEFPPTNKSFDVDFCTVARWDNGQIVEENLFYDLVSFMRQIGLSK